MVWEPRGMSGHRFSVKRRVCASLETLIRGQQAESQTGQLKSRQTADCCVHNRGLCRPDASPFLSHSLSTSFHSRDLYPGRPLNSSSKGINKAQMYCSAPKKQEKRDERARGKERGETERERKKERKISNSFVSSQ